MADTDNEAPDGAALWCVDCGARHNEAVVKEAKACPTCGSKGVPCSTRYDLRVEINWHELRILGIWADNWAAHSSEAGMQKICQSILHRLERQYPDLNPLTMGGEIRQVREGISSGDLPAGTVEQVAGTPAEELPVVVHGPGAVGHVRPSNG